MNSQHKKEGGMLIIFLIIVNLKIVGFKYFSSLLTLLILFFSYNFNQIFRFLNALNMRVVRLFDFWFRVQSLDVNWWINVINH